MSRELIRVANVDDLGNRGLHVVEHDGREVLLCRAGDEIYAVDNLCSHAGEKLCNGKLKGPKIFCPLHGAAFDIRTGEALSKPASQAIPTFEVVIVDGEIHLATDEGP